MIRVVVSGICGRMGSLAARAVAGSADLTLVGGVEAPGHASVGTKLRGVWDDAGLEVPVRSAISEFDPGSYDVIVDFSTPAQARACAAAAGTSGKGVVIGATGLSDAETAAIREASARAPVVLAPNASLGMNAVFGVVRRLAESLGAAFDVEIVETHHAAKLDAPSGTASRLACIVCEARGLDPEGDVCLGRSGRACARTPRQVGVHSVRGGAVVGQHVVRFISPLEEVSVAHEAFSRDAFAGGAVAAALFAARARPGLYDMLDVLGLVVSRGRETTP